MKEEEKKLWDEFDKIRETETPGSKRLVEAKNKVIEFYYPIVPNIASRLHRKVEAVNTDELTSFGVDGLYDAIKNYDRSRNVSFKTYASTRIRGSMIDEIRKTDWVPRLVRQRNAEMNNARQTLEYKHGRSVSDVEMANELGLNLEEYVKFEKKSTPLYCASMYAVNNDGENDGDEFFETDAYIDHKTKNPIDGLLKQEMCSKLLGKNFTKTERKIMYLHYYENMTLKEIASRVDLSESRVSQMHASILDRLQRKIKRNPKYFQELESMLNV